MIKHSRKLLAGLVVSFALANSALAITWTDTSTFQPQYLSSGQSYSGIFDITDNGFNSALHIVNSAYASFAFADDSDYDSSETVNITLGTPFLAFISGQEVDGDHPAVNFAWYGNNVSGTFLTDLNADGKLAWKVTVTEGDTYLKVAKLEATGTTRTQTPGVPDGGSTAALLGLGLAGLVALRKRLA